MVKDPNHPKEKDQVTGVETTGHEWDGIRELNNPAPRWWLWVFYVCVVFAIGYWFVYPAWPTLTGHTEGRMGWTQFNQLKAQQAEIVSLQARYGERFDKTPLGEIAKDPELYAFARAGGAAAFKNNCAVCHGTGAAGGPGFPNLNDDDWLWGGTLEQIAATIRYGARSGHPQAHENAMPAFGKDGVLQREEIETVADYVLNLAKGAKADPAVAAGKGAEIFAQNCAACHGEKGEGNTEMGAPRLSDAIWLYGGDRETVMTTIMNARAGVMPAWEGRLDERTLKQLAVYVHSLGGGK